MTEDSEAKAAGWPKGQAAPVWEDPPRGPASPVLAVDGFEGPLDWLLELARSRKIDLARLSIVAVAEAFAQAMDAALRRAPGAPAADLARWATWTVMAAQLTELRARLLLPADAPEARAALAEAETLRRQWALRAQAAAAADWLARRPQRGIDVFARGRPDGAWTVTKLDRPAAGAETIDIKPADDGPAGPAEDLPVPGGDITDLLRACLVALRLPPQAAVGLPRRVLFWSMGDAVDQMIRLLGTTPNPSRLEAFLPSLGTVGDGLQALQARAVVTATLMAGLELGRRGTLTLEQETPWQAILVRHGEGSPIMPSASGESMQ